MMDAKQAAVSHLARYRQADHAILVHHLIDDHGLDAGEFPMSRMHAKRRHKEAHQESHDHADA